jgi:hypothetical protein
MVDEQVLRERQLSPDTNNIKLQTTNNHWSLDKITHRIKELQRATCQASNFKHQTTSNFKLPTI